MTKYEIFDYDVDVWGKGGEDYIINDVIPTGIFIFTDTSKYSICKKLGLDAPYNDPDKIDVNYNEYTGVIYVYNNNNWRPICELHAVK